jgi:hypothetical protein
MKRVWRSLICGGFMAYSSVAFCDDAAPQQKAHILNSGNCFRFNSLLKNAGKFGGLRWANRFFEARSNAARR